jgi:hypothetical protein
MKSKADKPQKLKLYVTGAIITSGDPASWPESGYTLVSAESPSEAMSVAGDLSGEDSHEVQFGSPAILAHVPSR